jgi:predicted phage terminase large subunit-like protein
MNLEEVVAGLANPTSIAQHRNAGEQKFRELTSDELKYMRRRAKLDLFYLNTVILRYDKFDEEFHGKLFGWMLRNIRARFKAVLLPRSFLKSTGLTIGHSIQLALPNDPGLDFWPECLGPDSRILIAHENHESGAARFLVSITAHFLSNDLLMALYPEIIPDPRKQRVNRFELELAGRLGVYNEPTFDTMGVGGRSQGRHYNYLKLDDLIGDKARDSPTEMAKAKEWFDNVISFLSELPRDKFDLIGTRWAFDDLYAHAFELYGDRLLKYIVGAEVVDDKGALKPTCERLLSAEEISILKKNWKVWSSNYANDPSISASEFDKNWKRYFEYASPTTIKYRDGQHWYELSISDLDICVLIDPAMSGKTGFIVTGTHSDDKIFTLDAQKRQWRPPELVDYLFSTVARYKPRVVVIEEVLFSGLFQDWLPREMQIRGQYFTIVPHKVGKEKKEARVRQLSNYFAAGLVYFHQSQRDLITEYDSFGATEDYHMLDAMSQGPSHWARPFGKKQWDKFKQIEESLLKDHDPVTGYSG